MTNGRRSRRLAATLTLLSLFIAAAWTFVVVFEVGLLTGLALAGGGLVAWAVPATFLGWPGPTLADLVDFVVDLLFGVVEGIAAFFRSLFD